MASPDKFVMSDTWSDLARLKPAPEIDLDSLHTYRIERIRGALLRAGAAMCILIDPRSLRYAVDYRTYGLFQSHVPTTYLFVPLEGPIIIHGVYGEPPMTDEVRPARPLSFYDAAYRIPEASDLLAKDVIEYLIELGTDNRRIAVESTNPSLVQALVRHGLEVIDGTIVSQEARLLKSATELECMRWAISVAELGCSMIKRALTPGVTELQLWGLLNYTNLANDGDWHDGRMLASGPRINPWLQEASPRRVESGDLVAFDTDMVGPFGYFADISRTFHCGPEQPTKRQKQLYRFAYDEIQQNTALLKPGLRFTEFQKQALRMPEAFHKNAYSVLLHGAGMADEFPRINPIFGAPMHYDGALEPGMVVCVESYVGEVGERDGVKLEQQVLITENAYEVLSTFPFEETLLD